MFRFVRHRFGGICRHPQDCYRCTRILIDLSGKMHAATMKAAIGK